MKHKLTHNLSLKLLSLFVAFIIWLLIVNVDNPTKSVVFRDVKIQVINEDSVTEIDKVFDIISSDSVAIKVTERRSVLSTLTKEDFTVTADMENLTSMDTVPLTVTCSKASVTWDEIEINPSTMKVKLEQIKQNEFVVNVNVSGEAAKNYEVGKTEVVQGKTVQIAGAESMLNKISQVVADINVDNIRSDQRLSSQLHIYDKNGDEFSEAQMSRLQIKDADGVLISDNTVSVDVSVWKVESNLPITVESTGEPAEGYRLTGITTMPATVSLAGTDEALEALNGELCITEPISVDGATESFTAEIDLTEMLADMSDIKLVSDSEAIVTVNVQIEQTGDYTLTLPLSRLEVKDRPEELTLAFSPADEISIVVHRDSEGAPAISVNDILASIDLSIITEPGTYEIPVNIELPENYTLTADVVLVVTAEEAPQAPEANDVEE